MALQSLRTARFRSAAKTIHDARLLELDALYEMGYTPGRHAALLEILSTATVTVLGRDEAVAIRLVDTPDLQEDLIALTSITRVDRVWAAKHTIWARGALTEEFAVPRESGLWLLASTAALQVLA